MKSVKNVYYALHFSYYTGFLVDDLVVFDPNCRRVEYFQTPSCPSLILSLAFLAVVEHPASTTADLKKHALDPYDYKCKAYKSCNVC